MVVNLIKELVRCWVVRTGVLVESFCSQCRCSESSGCRFVRVVFREGGVGVDLVVGLVGEGVG